jgi:tetratricopeptide (TPR) repeat protein
MHFIFFCLGVMLSLDTFISPWSQYKFMPLTVTPIVLTAIWMGYLAGYGYMILFTVPARENVFFKALRRASKAIYFPVILAVIGYMSWSNFKITDPRDNEFLDEWATGLLKDLEEGDWLVSGFGVEDLVTLKAYHEGRKIHVINPALSQKEAYRWYMASLFDEPRMKGLAHISLKTLLNEWMEMDAKNAEHLAVSRIPDFWFAAGKHPVPAGFVYRGVDDKDALNIEQMVQEHEALWKTLDIVRLHRIKDGVGPNAAVAKAYLQEHSKMANNLGVLCHGREAYDLAVDCYQWARKLDVDNPSALLNLYALSEKGLVRDASRIKAAYVSFVSDLPAQLRIWSLSMDYGYVYDANAYLDRGMSWVVSGKPHLAIAEIKQAMEIAKDNDRMRLSLAYLYFADQQVGESEKLYVEMLQKNPDDLNALLGLARLCILRSEFATARGYMDRIKGQLDTVNTQFQLEEFALEYMMGRREEAKAILREIIKQDPNNAKAWTGLAVMASEEGDDKEFKNISKKIQNSKFIDDEVRVVFAQMLSARGDYRQARKILSIVLAGQPDNKLALEQLLRIHVREADRAEADRRVKQLLVLDPKSAYGNRVMGSLQFVRRQLLLAEASYRASIAADRNPEVLNSLAYILSVMNKFDEAYPLISESLEGNPRNPGAWDTMAMVQLGLGKYDLANTSILRALELSPGNRIFLMHHAEIFEKSGSKDEALKIVTELTKDLDSFPMEAQAELINLQARLRRDKQ